PGMLPQPHSATIVSRKLPRAIGIIELLKMPADVQPRSRGPRPRRRRRRGPAGADGEQDHAADDTRERHGSGHSRGEPEALIVLVEAMGPNVLVRSQLAALLARRHE